ncbi:protein TPR1-like [Castanea sativa]|uniref:protein TPR1-like n=1 Tax=Castanea sativa TaxID=21020 RepID=UPI003F649CCC
MEDGTDRTKPWQLSEIVDAVQRRLVTMPEGTDSSGKVVRLLYANSGLGVLALGSNSVQKLWKWARNERKRKFQASPRRELGGLNRGGHSLLV